MGRQFCIPVPTTTQFMKPKLSSGQDFRKKEAQIKQGQKQNFDTRQKETDLQPLKKGDEVWLPDRKEKGTIVKLPSTRGKVKN